MNNIELILSHNASWYEELIQSCTLLAETNRMIHLRSYRCSSSSMHVFYSSYIERVALKLSGEALEDLYSIRLIYSHCIKLFSSRLCTMFSQANNSTKNENGCSQQHTEQYFICANRYEEEYKHTALPSTCHFLLFKSSC